MKHTRHKIKIRLYIFVGVSLLISFFLIRALVPKIFLSNTPTLNPDFILTLQKSPLALVAYLGNIQEEATLKDHIETAKIPKTIAPPGTTFTPLVKGVSASEQEPSGKRYMKIEKGTKLEVRHVTLSSGKTVKIYIPVE